MQRRLTIGVLSPLISGAYFGKLLDGVTQTARRYGAHVIAIQTAPLWLLHGENETQPGHIPYADAHIDGYIAVLDAVHEDDLRAIQEAGKPVVSLSAVHPGLSCPAVLPDNEGGMAAAVRHLLSHGHRRIAFAGNMAQDDMRLRYAGYVQALREQGIEPDPELFIPIEDNLPWGGRRAAGILIAKGLPCSAVVAGNDLNALGLMARLQEAGYRIPDDIAVAGFDDIDMAQHASPPLTTLRQRYNALGREAALLLLAQLRGEDRQDGKANVHLLPTTLVCRTSCGCGVHKTLPLALPGCADGMTWKDDLVRQLVGALIHPLSPTPEHAPPALWSAVATLLEALEAAISGAEPVPNGRIAGAWRAICSISSTGEDLNTMLTLLEQAAGVLQARYPDDSARAERVAATLLQLRLELLRAYRGIAVTQRNAHEKTVEQYHGITMALLHTGAQALTELNWLDLTPIRYGCLGLWDTQSSDSVPSLQIAGCYTRSRPLDLAIGSRYTAESFPPPALLEIAAAEDEPGTVMIIPLNIPARSWGALALIGSIDSQFHMAHDTIRHASRMFSSVLEREALLASLEEQREAMRQSEERFRALWANVSDLVAILDAEGRFLFASPSHRHGLGYAPEMLHGRFARDFVHSADQDEIRQLFHDLIDAPDSGAAKSEVRLQHADGSIRLYEIQFVNRLHDPAIAGIIATARDITDRKAVEEATRYRALHDSLTDLPNRALLQESLEQALQRACQLEQPLAVLFLDLNRFKEVNDTFGHHYGDRLLQSVAARLRKIVRDTDTVARLGGDEFAVLLPGSNETGALATARRIAGALEASIEIDGESFQVGASIGISLYPAHGADPDTLMRAADAAMYVAKRGKTSYALYGNSAGTMSHDLPAIRRGA